MKPINKLIQVLLITWIISSCSNAKIKNSLSEDGLKGDVKVLTTLEYYATLKFGEPHSDSLKTKTVDVYDKRGNLIEEYVYNSKDSLRDKYIDKFDLQDNRIERHYFDFEDSSSNTKVLFTYDKEGYRTQNDVFTSKNVR